MTKTKLLSIFCWKLFPSHTQTAPQQLLFLLILMHLKCDHRHHKDFSCAKHTAAAPVLNIAILLHVVRPDKRAWVKDEWFPKNVFIGKSQNVRLSETRLNSWLHLMRCWPMNHMLFWKPLTVAIALLFLSWWLSVTQSLFHSTTWVTSCSL